MVKEAFERFSLWPAYSNLNLFIRNGVFLLLFINNIMVIGKRQDVNKIKACILKEQDGKDLGLIEYFIRFKIIRDRKNHNLIISQSQYIKKLLKRIGIDRANPSNLPILAGIVLKSTNNNILLKGDNIYLYKQIIRLTIYLLNNTRLDIAYAIGQLAHFILVLIITYLQMAKQLL